MNTHDIEPLAAEFRQLWDFARQATAPKEQHQGAIHSLPLSLPAIGGLLLVQHFLIPKWTTQHSDNDHCRPRLLHEPQNNSRA